MYSGEDGMVQVDEHLQVVVDGVVQGRVFAAGDCTRPLPSWGPTRSAYAGGIQGELVAANVLASLDNRPLKTWPLAKTGARHVPRMACVSLGPRQGILVFNNFTIRSAPLRRVCAFIKFVIERTLVWEAEGYVAAKLFWVFGHAMAALSNRFTPPPSY